MHPPRCPYRGNASVLRASTEVHNNYIYVCVLTCRAPPCCPRPQSLLRAAALQSAGLQGHSQGGRRCWTRTGARLVTYVAGHAEQATPQSEDGAEQELWRRYMRQHLGALLPRVQTQA